jgi:spore maturation protein CgeB
VKTNPPAGRLLVVGNDGGTNIGASLVRSARSIGLDADINDARGAFAAPKPIARVNWWVRGRRPTHLRSFSAAVLERCRRERPTWLITTGLAPVERRALDRIRDLGVITINYLTDDPWNRAFSSKWFFDALVAYDRVFSPRTSNLEDLKRLGCRRVEYLPFAADPEIFFPQEPSPDEEGRLRSDVCFAGGSERERVPLLSAMIDAGLDVAVYGDAWDRFPETRRAWRGYATPTLLRKSTRTAAVSLCLVRRSNRDGHTMRTFEVPFMGGCMLVEDTAEHRAIFGENDRAVVYFGSVSEGVSGARALIADPARRHRLAAAAHALVANGQHTYTDRLRAMVAADR